MFADSIIGCKSIGLHWQFQSDNLGQSMASTVSYVENGVKHEFVSGQNNLSAYDWVVEVIKHSCAGEQVSIEFDREKTDMNAFLQVLKALHIQDICIDGVALKMD